MVAVSDRRGSGKPRPKSEGFELYHNSAPNGSPESPPLPWAEYSEPKKSAGDDRLLKNRADHRSSPNVASKRAPAALPLPPQARSQGGARGDPEPPLPRAGSLACFPEAARAGVLVTNGKWELSRKPSGSVPALGRYTDSATGQAVRRPAGVRVCSPRGSAPRWRGPAARLWVGLVTPAVTVQGLGGCRGAQSFPGLVRLSGPASPQVDRRWAARGDCPLHPWLGSIALRRVTFLPLALPTRSAPESWREERVCARSSREDNVRLHGEPLRGGLSP